MSSGAKLGVAPHLEACTEADTQPAAGGGGVKDSGRHAQMRRYSAHGGIADSWKAQLGSCQALPDEDRRALDATAGAIRAAAARACGGNPVQCGFQAAGWHAVQCKAPLETARGEHSASKPKEHGCSGFRVASRAWAKVDVASHFGKGNGAGERECVHCGTVVRGDKFQLKRHMGACRRLPAEDRRVMDESAVAKGAVGAGVYGSNPVYRGFKITGWHVAQCRACLETVRGDSSRLKRHKERRCRGFPVTWAEVDVTSHFGEGKAAGEWQCLHCGAAVRGHKPHLKQHMGACRRLPEKDRRALDEGEVAKAAAGAGMYGSNPVYRGFQVTGWHVAQCKACSETVRSNSTNLEKHKERGCRGFPATWSEVDVASHFGAGKTAGEWQCLHCGAAVRGHTIKLKRHVGACRRVPEEHRRALDESEVAKAAAGAGMYGSNPVYRGFQVTGWHVAQCKACLETLRGDSRHLTQHKEGRCRGFPATWSEVDVASHFGEGNGAGERECVHCGTVVRGDTSQLKRHMGACRRLPEEDRHALDESEVAKAAAGKGRYGSNPVYREFQVTGLHVAQCKVCLEPVRGASTDLKRHKEHCVGPPADTPDRATKRRRVSHRRDRGAQPASGPCTTRRRGHSVPQSLTTPEKHGLAMSVGASLSQCDLPHSGGLPLSAAGSAARPPVCAGAGAGAAPSCGVAKPVVWSSQTCPGDGSKRESGTAAAPAASSSSSVAGAVVASRAVAVAPARGGGSGVGDSACGARHRWASGVRTTRGSEAVVAAMRARYKRLYAVNGSG